MRRFLPSRLARTALLCAPALLASCSAFHDDRPSYKKWADRTPTSVEQNHWNLGSVAPRMIYAATGYRADDWKTYRDYQSEQKRQINETLSRHILNRNPVTPLQTEDRSYGQERRPHSIWGPAALRDYFHLTSVVVGGAFAASSAGVFLPIPFDSLVATVEEGGLEEFRAGFGGTSTPRSRHTRYNPPATSDFELKHP